jgi:two-component system cell cycle sensor histidine kinase/response regulator CckA
MGFSGRHPGIQHHIAATGKLKAPWMRKENRAMDRIIAIPIPIRRSNEVPPGKTTGGPKWHFCMFAILLLVLCLGSVLNTLPAQFIGLTAFGSLIFCHFMDTMTYQKSDRRLAAIIEASPNPIIVYNNQGHPQMLNPAFSRVFGWTLEELRGRCIPFVPESEKAITARKVGEIFQTGQPVSFETRRMTHAGDIREVIVSAAIALGRGKTPFEMVVNITDITEQKRFEAQLHQARKMEAIGALAGGIAHDFNNLLSPLIGYSEMLKDDLPADSPLREKADEILTAGRRAKDLVTQILAFSRKSDAKPEATNIQPFITEILKLIRVSIPSNIRILQHIDEDCGPVMANPTQIHQVVMNLATNAYHAMEGAGGTLSVTLGQVDTGLDPSRFEGLPPGKYAHLIVADTGIGIEKQNLAKLFDPYFTTKDKNKGTGLGLSVVQGIIDSAGGSIQVFSEPGQGAQFHVFWPQTQYRKKTAAACLKTPVPGGNEKILLVDDEAAIVKMVRQVLERLGYEVDAHASGAEALAAFKDDPDSFGLVLTDMTMPEMTGDRLAREIMAVRPAIPVLVSTGYCNKRLLEMVTKTGIKGIIKKPAGKSELAVAVRKALDDSAVSIAPAVRIRRAGRATAADSLPECA